MLDFALSPAKFARDSVNIDHLHGLEDYAFHLCGEEHSCSMQCTAEGIRQIEIAPQLIEAAFTGRHETFQYTKYSQVVKRLKCVKSIQPGMVAHDCRLVTCSRNMERDFSCNGERQAYLTCF
ncbi:uncharacterized protein EDB93DRAFT_1183028 [Suillus bovinus]|uniref:uncharacterized protein n=1 Tax=Suillus bovinus TaxID=48563 RepID=UPI001B886678|nr:uncharacterized protein EDB93DRAFT_1183028 [Suillus bovinus]KAG2129176.1 hypothetical protein EDB93DRAFT_1183028 [Suillus bovinus]